MLGSSPERGTRERRKDWVPKARVGRPECHPECLSP